MTRSLYVPDLLIAIIQITREDPQTGSIIIVCFLIFTGLFAVFAFNMSALEEEREENRFVSEKTAKIHLKSDIFFMVLDIKKELKTEQEEEKREESKVKLIRLNKWTVKDTLDEIKELNPDTYQKFMEDIIKSYNAGEALVLKD